MYIVVFVTTKNIEEAEKIARKLVEEKLVACANILNGVKSIFQWEGKMDHAQETLLILKSRQELFPKIVKAVKSVHSYQLPEIIALPIVEGSEDYLNWIKEETK